jgi:mycothiol system anti-sigma-R factor
VREKCRHTLEQAYLFLDGEVLSAEERHEIQVHLEECAPCFERYGLDREVTLIIHRLRGSQPCPQSLREKVQNLIREA